MKRHTSDGVETIILELATGRSTMRYILIGFSLHYRVPERIISHIGCRKIHMGNVDQKTLIYIYYVVYTYTSEEYNYNIHGSRFL